MAPITVHHSVHEREGYYLHHSRIYLTISRMLVCVNCDLVKLYHFICFVTCWWYDIVLRVLIPASKFRCAVLLEPLN